MVPAFLLFVTDMPGGTTKTIRDTGCDVAISADGRTIATGGPGAPLLWDAATGESVRGGAAAR